MKLRIILLDGNQVDAVVPNTFDMSVWVATMRSMNCMLGPGIYIPIKQIKIAMLLNEEGESIDKDVVLGMTKQ